MQRAAVLPYPSEWAVAYIAKGLPKRLGVCQLCHWRRANRRTDRQALWTAVRSCSPCYIIRNATSRTLRRCSHPNLQLPYINRHLKVLLPWTRTGRRRHKLPYAPSALTRHPHAPRQAHRPGGAAELQAQNPGPMVEEVPAGTVGVDLALGHRTALQHIRGHVSGMTERPLSEGLCVSATFFTLTPRWP